MADPPFSTDPLDNPIDPTDYVDNIQDNFSRCENEIKDLDSRLKSATGTGTFDPFLEQGQLEVNGNFRLHRRMQEVSRTQVIPVDGNVFVNAQYTAAASGAGLGIVGAGIYSYHPTVCPGWYAPLALMPASGGAAVDGFGDEAGGGLGMRINIPAGARLNGSNDESVIFQPLSVHNSSEKWAGRQLRAAIEYEHDAAPGLEPEIYAAWDVGGARTFSHSSFSVPGAVLPATGIGTRGTLTFDFTPPAAATMLEIGIRVRDPAAHSFIFRRFIVSSNLNRSLALAYPGIIPTEQILIDSHYFRSIQGIRGTDFFPAAAPMLVGAGYRRDWIADDRRPIITPTQSVTLARWSAGQAGVYARPLIVTQIAPISGVLLASVTDGVVVDMTEKSVNQGGPGFANYDDWKSLVVPQCLISMPAVPVGKDFNPDFMLEYDGEWLATFKPLLLP